MKASFVSDEIVKGQNNWPVQIGRYRCIVLDVARAALQVPIISANNAKGRRDPRGLRLICDKEAHLLIVERMKALELSDTGSFQGHPILVSE